MMARTSDLDPRIARFIGLADRLRAAAEPFDDEMTIDAALTLAVFRGTQTPAEAAGLADLLQRLAADCLSLAKRGAN